MTRILMLWILTSVVAHAQSNINKDSAVAAILQRVKPPSFPDLEIEITDYGGNGNAKKDNKKAFDRAMQFLKKKGGGMLRVPKGDYLIDGPIHFESNVNLHLDKGAILRFGDNPEDYLPLVETSWEGTFINNYSPLIYAKDKENLAISGSGTIDGEGSKTWASWKAKEDDGKQLSRKMNHEKLPLDQRQLGEGYFLRPQLIQIFDSKNILIEGVHIVDAPFWCTHLLRSNNITIRNISFDAYNKNNDGIDLEYSSDVLIENVDFDNGDDNIAIKAGRDDDGRTNSETPSENIVVRNNKFKGLHALVIGSEMSAGVRNVFVDNNQASGYLKRGIYFKTNSDRGGYIKDIHISNIELGNTEDCIFMTANYHGEGSGNHVSKISDIYLSNISCKLASNTGIVVEGYSTKKAENIYFDGIRIDSTNNGMTLINTKNVLINEIIIGDEAGTPSSVK